jgi:glyoxylase-like metal-dependent hydrolase (beta-lactamase superfamily II)
MQFRTIVVGGFEVNCVVLWQDPAQAWIVDPGAEGARIRDFLRREHLQVAQYVCTHGHVDHLSALDDLLVTHPAPVCLHAADAAWAFSALNRIPPAYPAPPQSPRSLQTDLADGATLDRGGLTARLITTPGHTPGSFCLYFAAEKLLLSGDTLFAGSVGRTDLPGSDGRELQRSLKKLLALPDDTQIIAGHGPHTSLHEERRTNPYLSH